MISKALYNYFKFSHRSRMVATIGCLLSVTFETFQKAWWRSHQLFLNFVSLVIKTLLLIPLMSMNLMLLSCYSCFHCPASSVWLSKLSTYIGQTAFHLMYLALSFGILFVYLTICLSNHLTTILTTTMLKLADCNKLRFIFGILFVYLTAFVSDLQCLNKRIALCVYAYFNLTKFAPLHSLHESN